MAKNRGVHVVCGQGQLSGARLSEEQTTHVISATNLFTN